MVRLHSRTMSLLWGLSGRPLRLDAARHPFAQTELLWELDPVYRKSLAALRVRKIRASKRGAHGCVLECRLHLNAIVLAHAAVGQADVALIGMHCIEPANARFRCEISPQ